jgi:hypothetical protein
VIRDLEHLGDDALRRFVAAATNGARIYWFSSFASPRSSCRIAR